MKIKNLGNKLYYQLNLNVPVSVKDTGIPRRTSIELLNSNDMGELLPFRP